LIEENFMAARPLPVIREYRLEPPGHQQGASCDRDGPALAPIRLLVKTEEGFAPRPLEELNRLFTHIFTRPLDCAGLMLGLQAVANAVNERDLPRAMIATTQMRLPTLSAAESRRAATAERLLKASEDDPDHPGWPKGTPGGLGGKFRPKDAAAEGAGMVERKKTAEALERFQRRALIRAALRKLLSPARVARLMGEAAANAAPALNAVADAAMMADIAAMAADFSQLKRDADAAIEFIKNGPYKLEDLLVDKEERSFSSFPELKKLDLGKFYGPAGDGWEYHHIVEQNRQETFPAAWMNSTRNVIRSPKLLHEEINGAYARKDDKLSASLRQSLEGGRFDQQYQVGIGILRDLGVIE
jgi:hypothetical protein